MPSKAALANHLRWSGADPLPSDTGLVVLCPYCDGTARPCTGADVYPHRPDLADKRFYRCNPCDALVGCHPGTWRPLGKPANAELRKARMAAHGAFDVLWKHKKHGLTRRQAYGWLAGELGIHRNDCHIGLFDVAMCKRVVQLSHARRGFPAHTLNQ